MLDLSQRKNASRAAEPPTNQKPFAQESIREETQATLKESEGCPGEEAARPPALVHARHSFKVVEREA